jgi:hypothetical protein
VKKDIIPQSVQREDFELDEQKHANKNEDPPYVLVLKRQNVRLFPNNIKVALYYSDKIDKHFSVPYGSGIDAPIQSEETIIISEEQKLVSNILRVFCELSEENQVKMIDMVLGDVDSYNKVKEFVKK